MTAQIPDEFRYEGETYSLIGLSGEGLFRAEDFGLELVSASTACWRGNVMKYDCIDGQLVLDGLDIRTNKEPPKINGKNPVKATGPHKMFFSHSYLNLGLRTKFTGSMLLGKDFIDSMYVHMGFPRAIAFETVLEIQVQDGDIISVSDLSEKMAEERHQNRHKGARPDSSSREDIEKWVDETFSLDYEID